MIIKTKTVCVCVREREREREGERGREERDEGLKIIITYIITRDC